MWHISTFRRGECQEPSKRQTMCSTATLAVVTLHVVAALCLSSYANAFSPASSQNSPAVTQPLFTRNLGYIKDPTTVLSSTTANNGRQAAHPTQLNALNVSPAAWSAIGHVIGGVSGALIVAPATKSGGWYEKIDLPSWVPPNGLFAPVWTTLYACMGVAAARVYKLSNGGLSSAPMILWAVHYALNLAWAPAFFGKQMLRLAQAINIALISTLLPIIVMYYRLDRLSAYLLVPYLVWTTFATILNGAICRRNPTSKDGINDAKFQSKLIQVQKDAAAYADSW